MVATRRYADYVREAVKAGADLIISGAGLPTELPELVKGTSTKIAPIISNLKGAKVILKYWEKKHSRIWTGRLRWALTACRLRRAL